MIKLKDINESYTVIEIPDTEEGFDLKIKIMNSLSIYVDGYQFMPSFRAGMWDGKKKFYSQTPTGLIIPKGLSYFIIDKLKSWGYNVTYEENEFKFNITKEEILKFIEELKIPFKPRDYQIDAILYALNNKRGILLSATSSGKSFMIYVIVRYLLDKLKFKGALIVPTVNLVEQMFSDFKEYRWNNLDEYVHKIYSGKEKHFDKPLTISTWQSLRKSLYLFPELDFIIIDESHTAKSENLEKIIKASINAKYKLGFTGTLPQNTIDKMTLLSTLGKPKKIITPQELIDLGYATPIKVIMFFIQYNKEICNTFWKKMNSFQSEVKFIEELESRNEFIANVALKLSEKKENNLILYNKISHGEELLFRIIKKKLNLSENIDKFVYKNQIKQIKEDKIYIVQSEKDILCERKDNIIVLDELNLFFIRGDVKGNKREEIRKMLELQDGGILIATYGTLSTGVNIKKIHNIHLVSSTKSFIRLNQSIGRGMRQHKDKNITKIFDYVDDFSTCRKRKNYMLKHADERINLYMQNAYPIIEKNIKIGD